MACRSPWSPHGHHGVDGHVHELTVVRLGQAGHVRADGSVDIRGHFQMTAIGGERDSTAAPDGHRDRIVDRPSPPRRDKIVR